MDPIDWIISKNKHRRHLEPAQLALIGETLATLKLGSNQYTAKEGLLASKPSLKSQGEVAKDLGIDPTLISNARTLKRDAVQNVIDMVPLMGRVVEIEDEMAVMRYMLPVMTGARPHQAQR
jgi:hypothetical protein